MVGPDFSAPLLRHCPCTSACLDTRLLSDCTPTLSPLGVVFGLDSVSPGDSVGSRPAPSLLVPGLPVDVSTGPVQDC